MISAFFPGHENIPLFPDHALLTPLKYEFAPCVGFRGLPLQTVANAVAKTTEIHSLIVRRSESDIEVSAALVPSGDPEGESVQYWSSSFWWSPAVLGVPRW